MHLQIGYMLDGLVRSDVSLQSSCKKADPLYDGDLPEFLLLLLLAVFKIDSREQLLAVSLTKMNVTYYVGGTRPSLLDAYQVCTFFILSGLRGLYTQR